MRERLYFGQTWRIPFDTAAADGGAEGFSATIEAADFDVYQNLGTTQRTSTAGFTVSETFDGVTGAHALVLDLNDDTDVGFYYHGFDLDVLFSPDETVDSQTVAKWIASGVMETQPEHAVRTLRQYMYPTNGFISTTASNSTTVINLTDIVDAATAKMKGELLAFHDATDDRLIIVRVTAFTYPLATVEMLEGGAMHAAVAAGDHVWRVGQFTAKSSSVTDLATASALSSVADGVTAILARLPLPVQGDALPNLYVFMRDANGDGVSGLTLTVTRSIDGTAFASATGTAAEIGNGVYQFDASAADMNGGIICFRFVGTGAIDYFLPIVTDGAF